MNSLKFALLALVTFSLTVADSHAQESTVLTAFKCLKNLSTPEAVKVVERAQSRYSELHSFSAEFFQYSYLAAVDQGEESGGTVKFLSKGNMRWDYDRPEAQTFIVRDQTVWLFQPRLSQVVIDSISQVVISQLPTSFLMGIGDLTKDFKLVEGCKTSAGTRIKLQPVSATSNGTGQGLEAFELLVNDQSGLPQGANILDLGGNKTAFLFRALKADQGSASASDFELKIPDGIDIDDHRIEKEK